MKQLTREQNLALINFIRNYHAFDSFQANVHRLKKNAQLLPTNFMVSSYEPISTASLPRGSTWCWNQSNAKVFTQLDPSTILVFRKISTKKKTTSVVSAPSYKVWLYEVQRIGLCNQYFLWCEKGLEREIEFTEKEGVSTEIGIIFPELISTESLSFLSPFVEEHLAKELGWL